MFDKRLLGYDVEQVDNEISSMSAKLEIQQKDLDYLRNENLKLKQKIASKIKKDV